MMIISFWLVKMLKKWLVLVMVVLFVVVSGYFVCFSVVLIVLLKCVFLVVSVLFDSVEVL